LDWITDFFERIGWPEGVDVISQHSGDPSTGGASDTGESD